MTTSPTRGGRIAAVLDLALPVTCAVCAAPTAQPLCAGCSAAVRAELFAGGPRPVTPLPRPDGMPLTVAAGRYAGALAAAVTAYKDRDRRDLAAVLAGLAGAALDVVLGASAPHRSALATGEGVVVVPVPSSRSSVRRRGDAPLRALVRRAARGFGAHELRCADVLLVGRRVADQAGLSAPERAANLASAFRAGDRRPLARGAPVVVLDDVVTTGATLVECCRALAAAGAGPVVGVAVAATERRQQGRL